jgi:hypothetical protein
MEFDLIGLNVVEQDVDIAGTNQRIEDHEVAAACEGASRATNRLKDHLVLGSRAYLPASQSSYF